MQTIVFSTFVPMLRLAPGCGPHHLDHVPGMAPFDPPGLYSESWPAETRYPASNSHNVAIMGAS